MTSIEEKTLMLGLICLARAMANAGANCSDIDIDLGGGAGERGQRAATLRFRILLVSSAVDGEGAAE